MHTSRHAYKPIYYNISKREHRMIIIYSIDLHVRWYNGCNCSTLYYKCIQSIPIYTDVISSIYLT